MRAVSWSNRAAICALFLASLTAPVRADEALTARNKEIVRDFYTTVLIGRDVDAAPRFLSPGYVQHSAGIPSGLRGFMNVFRKAFAVKQLPDYKREIVRIVGENDIVIVFDRQGATHANAGITWCCSSTCSASKTGRLSSIGTQTPVRPPDNDPVD